MRRGSSSDGSPVDGPPPDVAARIEAQVDAIMRAAIVDARRALPFLPEITIHYNEQRRMLTPVRAMAAGMLEQIESAYRRANPDKEPP